MPTVSINSTGYEVYADVAIATTYLQADLRYSQVWEQFTNKEAALVQAARALDGVKWAGEKASDGQVLEWPRTGVDGEDPATVPTSIVDACCLLAGMLAVSPTAIAKAQQGNNKSEVSAGGGVGVKYFKRDAGQALPEEAAKLTRHLLGASGSAFGAFVAKTKVGTFTEDRFCVGG